jgi:hypothetical protein
MLSIVPELKALFNKNEEEALDEAEVAKLLNKLTVRHHMSHSRDLFVLFIVSVLYLILLTSYVKIGSWRQLGGYGLR